MTPAQDYLVVGGAIVSVVGSGSLWAYWAKHQAPAPVEEKPAPVVTCGECSLELDDTNRAPGCLSHDTCLDCGPTPHCDECSHYYADAVWTADLFLDAETYRMDFETDTDWGVAR